MQTTIFESIVIEMASLSLEATRPCGYVGKFQVISCVRIADDVWFVSASRGKDSPIVMNLFDNEGKEIQGGSVCWRSYTHIVMDLMKLGIRKVA